MNQTVQTFLAALAIIVTVVGGFTIIKTDITALQVTVADMKERAIEDRKSLREQMREQFSIFDAKIQKLAR